MDPCLYFFEYSPDVLKKKTWVLDIFIIHNNDKKCFIKINQESSPQEIWIWIHFLEINGSPSLYITPPLESEHLVNANNKVRLLEINIANTSDSIFICYIYVQYINIWNLS